MCVSPLRVYSSSVYLSYLHILSSRVHPFSVCTLCVYPLYVSPLYVCPLSVCIYPCVSIRVYLPPLRMGPLFVCIPSPCVSRPLRITSPCVSFLRAYPFSVRTVMGWRLWLGPVGGIQSTRLYIGRIDGNPQ